MGGVLGILTQGIAEQANNLTGQQIEEMRKERFKQLKKLPTTRRRSDPVIQFALSQEEE